MNPLTLNPWALLGGAAIAVAIGFSGGWAINGWRLEANVAKLERDNAKNLADSANAALDQLGQRMGSMNTAASNAQISIATLSTTMAQIMRNQKNVQIQQPLPVDCIPDRRRLDGLRDAVSAANAAITGTAARPDAGRAVQDPARP
jgi:hypothetical protein